MLYYSIFNNFFELNLFSNLILVFNLIIMYMYKFFYMYINLLTLKLWVSNSLVFTIKFIILIATLVFIRGGIPRYRYDFLTKIGWVKYLSLVLAIFLTSLIFNYTI